MAANNSTYPVGFYFEVSFKGEDAAFQEVSGISKEMNTEEVWSGGENRFKYHLPTFSKSPNLVLKRALVQSGSQLVDWCASVMDDGLAAPIETHDVSVKLLDAEGNAGSMWTFYDAYPIKYAISDLKSQANDLVIESIELTYTYFEITEDTSIADLFA